MTTSRLRTQKTPSVFKSRSERLRRAVRHDLDAFNANGTKENLNKLADAIRAHVPEAAAVSPEQSSYRTRFAVKVASPTQFDAHLRENTGGFNTPASFAHARISGVLSGDQGVIVRSDALISKRNSALRGAFARAQMAQGEHELPWQSFEKALQIDATSPDNTYQRRRQLVSDAVYDWARASAQGRRRGHLKTLDDLLSAPVSKDGPTFAQQYGLDFDGLSMWSILPEPVTPPVVVPREPLPRDWLDTAKKQHDEWVDAAKPLVQKPLTEGTVPSDKDIKRVAAATLKHPFIEGVSAHLADSQTTDPKVLKQQVLAANQRLLDALEHPQAEELLLGLFDKTVSLPTVLSPKVRNVIKTTLQSVSLSASDALALKATWEFRDAVEAALPKDFIIAKKSLDGKPIFDANEFISLVSYGFYRWVNNPDVSIRASTADIKSFVADVEKLKDDPGALIGRTLAQLGPGFVKIAQLLGNRPDLVDPKHRPTLARLSDGAIEVPLAGPRSISSVVEADLRDNAIAYEFLQMEKRRLQANKADVPQPPEGYVAVADWLYLSPKPIGIGSMGQTYRGWLPDGRVVAAKVVKPGAAPLFADNLESMEQVAQGPLQAMVSEVRRLSPSEGNMVLEGQTMNEMRPRLALLGAHIPEVILATRNVLIQELAKGVKPTTLTEPSSRLAAARKTRWTVFGQVVTGRFHTDPHEGNIFYWDAEGRLTLIDWGMNSRAKVREILLLGALVTAAQFSSSSMAIRALRSADENKATLPETYARIVEKSFAAKDNAFDRAEEMLSELQLSDGRISSGIVQAAKALMLADGVARKLSQ